jgi:hypothetical protein
VTVSVALRGAFVSLPFEQIRNERDIGPKKDEAEDLTFGLVAG